MKSSQQQLGMAWYLGTIQYCVCLSAGGALWFLIAYAHDFFQGDPATQVFAFMVLLTLIVLEAWWAHMPTVGNPIGEIIFDILSSATLAGFGMGIVMTILLWLPRR